MPITMEPPLRLHDISNRLIDVCDTIIEDQQFIINNNKNNKNVNNEYSKNGKKYKLTSDGNFIRVQGEDKHLIISNSYENFKFNYSILSSYSILKNCGNILIDYPKLSLAIIFTSREIELNKWYDESSKILIAEQNPSINLNNLIENFEFDSINYISNIDSNLRSQLINLGSLILTATKINFFQTDHNVTSPTLEGYALRKLIFDNFGENALNSIDIYNALRAFSHWCSIKGIFYKLNLPNLKINNILIHNFKTFPLIPFWIKDSLYGRYPAGCSKLSLIKKSIKIISNSIYGKLIEFPNYLNFKTFNDLCNDIELDPLKYHIRSATLNLSINLPLEINKIFSNSNIWLEFISSILQAIGNYKLPFENNNNNSNNNLIVSNKILKIKFLKDKKLYQSTCQLVNKIQNLEKLNNNKLNDKQLLDLLGGSVQNSISSVCQF